jgi:hypothetical protein
MATHTDLGNAYSEPENGALFVKFIGACLLKAAAIRTESGATTNHANRLVWANAILSSDQTAVYARVRASKNYALATDANVQFSPTNVTDGDISAAVENGLAVLANGS